MISNSSHENDREYFETWGKKQTWKAKNIFKKNKTLKKDTKITEMTFVSLF